MGKHSIFQINKVKNSKNFEILLSKKDFLDILQAITFDIFMLEIFFIYFILGIIQENKESKSHRLIQTHYVLLQNWEKIRIFFILECVLLISMCNNFS